MQTHPKIYSKRAIQFFSLFFTTVFGGVLLMQNLKEIGKRKEAFTVLIYSILYTILSFLLVYFITEKPAPSLTLVTNYIGGYCLGIFFNQHISSPDDFEKKKIWKPLIVSIAITLPFIFATVLPKKQKQNLFKEILSAASEKNEEAKAENNFLKNYEVRNTEIKGTVISGGNLFLKDSINVSHYIKPGYKFELLNQRIYKRRILVKILSNSSDNIYDGRVGWLDISNTTLVNYFNAENNLVDTVYTNKYLVVPSKR